MTDYQEHQSANERPSRGYVHLIEPGDRTELTGDEELEIIKFPEKFIGSIGKASIYLSRSTPEYKWVDQDSGTGLRLSSSGM